MFAFVFPADQMPSATTATKDFEEMPAFFRFMIQNVQWFFAGFWSLCVVTLVAAIGLLRRKNWARLVFIVLMALGVVWNLGGIWMQEQMMSSFPKFPSDAPADFEAHFETVMTVMRYAMGVFAIGISLLFAWIIKRLVSRPIRAEFNAL
jgi:hypothetical protein